MNVEYFLIVQLMFATMTVHVLAVFSFLGIQLYLFILLMSDVISFTSFLSE